MQQNVLKLKDLRGQYLRSQRTSEFITEGLARNPPYVQEKFRVKISKRTPAYEIDSYKSEATDKAKLEVSRFKIRMQHWEEEIKMLRAEIATALSRPNASVRDKINFEQQIKRDEDMNFKRREDEMKIIKDKFETEMKSGADQFLIKYTEDAESGNIIGNADRLNNFSDRYRRRGYQRVDWRGRWHFW